MFCDEFVQTRVLTRSLNSGRKHCLGDPPCQARFGRIIQLHKLWWNEGDQTSVTPVLETEQTSSPLFLVNSFIAAATEAQASEHINQPRDYIHLSHGHSSLHAGAASCWHCLCLCCLPLLLPVLTVLPIRRAGEKATNLEGCWVCCQREACLALRADDKRISFFFFYSCTLMWDQITSRVHTFIWLNCICAPKYERAEVPFYRLRNKQKRNVIATSKAWQGQNKAGQSL